MASSIHILDSKGAPLISRAYRGDVSLNVSAAFIKHVLEEEEMNVAPVFEVDGLVFVWLRHNNVFFVTVSKVNCIPSLQLAFMRRAIEVFESYFSSVTEESVRDNFVIIYELLDEMVDFGLPQYTEAKVLQEYVTQEGLVLQLQQMLPGGDDSLDVKALPASVSGVNGATQCRPPGIKHRKNEVYLDVVETVNLLVGQDGETIQSDISGALKMRVKLSGMPEVKLGLNDKLLMEAAGKRTGKGKTVELDDMKFHHCVKLNKFESDRTISFCPPEGSFELMSYRMTQKLKPLIHTEVQVIRHGTSRVEMLLKAHATYKKSVSANEVNILIPIPSDADTPSAKANVGSLQYHPDREGLVWTVKQFGGGREFMCRCVYTLPSVRTSDPAAFARRPINVQFDIPYFTASGFVVRYLKVTEKSGYETSPWVRYSTQSGEYQIRTT